MPSIFSSHHFKGIPLLGSCAYYLVGFEEEQQPIFFHPSQDVFLPNCLHSAPEETLPEVLQFALHLLQRDRIIPGAGSRKLSCCKALQDLCLKEPKVTSKGRRELANKHKTSVQMSWCLQGFSRQPPNSFENSLVSTFQCSAALILSSTPEQNCNIFETIALALIQ